MNNMNSKINMKGLRFNTVLLVKELVKRGVQIDMIQGTPFLRATFGDQVEILDGDLSTQVPSVYYNIITNKFLTKMFLKKSKLPVVPGSMFSLNDPVNILNFCKNQIKFPVIIKPIDLASGDLVFTNINKEDELMDILKYFRLNIDQYNSKHPNNVLVEKHIDNVADFRFTVFEDGSIYGVKRQCPEVIGDGQLSIKALVEKINKTRVNPRKTCLNEIWLDDTHAQITLMKQNLTAESIPKKGQNVLIRHHSNICYGGSCDDITDDIHEDYKFILRKVLKLFPRMPFFGVDIFTKDISQKPTQGNYLINELEVTPGFSLHLLPGTGKSRNIISKAADILFPETAKG